MITHIKELKNRPHFTLITRNEDLVEVCQWARMKSAVALDTEFIRVRSYYPKLGLIQLYDGDRVSLIDPVEIDDFSPFIALLADPAVIKVLHACYEDLEVFQYYFQQLPTPMIDTQIMANFLGFSSSPGLATLLKHYFDLNLDKGASRTDWLARPLSEKQLQYAAADVWYLLPLYHQMNNSLEKTPWKSAVNFDCEMLGAKHLEVKDNEQAYLNIPNAWRLNSVELIRLKLLAKWRQQEAIKRDLALNFVVKNESLWLMAKHGAESTSDLLQLGLNPHEVRIHGKKMLQLVNQIKWIPEPDYPLPIRKLSDDPRYKKAIKDLQQKLKEIAPPDLAADVIASRRDLESLLKWVWLKKEDPEQLPVLLQGWRKPFGDILLTVL
ncbi:MAG TPA: ribonuclease D [Pasteurellaceae bacterium]|nr:ribonuclease D [Pasteurellaceae bacterium]